MGKHARCITCLLDMDVGFATQVCLLCLRIFLKILLMDTCRLHMVCIGISVIYWWSLFVVILTGVILVNYCEH